MEEKIRFEVTGMGNFIFPGLGRVKASTRDILTAVGEKQICWARNCPTLTEIKEKGGKKQVKDGDNR